MMYKNCIYNYNELFPLIKNEKIVIFGAGNNGSKLCRRLFQDNYSGRIIFCDNNVNKQGKEIFGCKIYSVEESVKQFDNPKFLIATGIPVQPYFSEIIAQLLNYVDEKRILLVSIESIYIKSKNQRIRNSQRYVENLLKQSHCLEKVDKIKQIKSITFRDPLIGGTGGGPAKVLEIQEQILGDMCNNIKLTYHYKIENDFSVNLDYSLSSIIANIEFARRLSQSDKQVAYIVHDIFSAFGLAMNGKHYILVYHSQGEKAYEMKNMGSSLLSEEEELIKRIELVSIRNASYVCFPSSGAEKFFWKSWGIKDIPEYSHGMPLYNCLAEKDMTKFTKITGLKKDNDLFTILSIGQMTSAKGIDRIPAFLDGLSSQIKEKIRWIIVATGPLKNDILNSIDQIAMSNNRIIYFQFDKLPHSDINYLFKISDAYLMLHRISVFDLATLEAMYNNITIMLSDIPGNREFNQQNNIIMIPDNADFEKIASLIYADKKTNKKVYDMYFSSEVFKQRYINMIYSLVKKCLEEGK